ncbi:MAG: hypothetical protein SNJ78_07670 [Spirochaetales bacterium]
MTINQTRIVLFSIGLAAFLASGIGFLFRGERITVPAVSIRGESYEYRDTGIYRYSAERVVQEGIGWDAVTFFLVVPAYWGVLFLSRRLEVRETLFLIGFLSYFVYQYLEYTMFWALGPLFPLHLVLFSSSMAGILILLSRIRIKELPGYFSDRFPLKGVGWISAFMGVVLLGMWVPFVYRALQGDIAGKLYGSTTLVVQALDLGLIVPLAFWTAFACKQKKSVAYLLSTIMVVKLITMGSALCAMILNVWREGGRFEGVPLGIFGSGVLYGLWLINKIYRSYQSEKEAISR